MIGGKLCEKAWAFFEWGYRSVRDHFPHYLIALFTLLLAIFAYFAWDEATISTTALQGQLNEARKATIANNRAWLGVVSMVLASPVENGKPIDFSVRMENTGKSPALHAVIVYNEFTIPYILDRVGTYTDYEPSQLNTTCEGVRLAADGGFVISPGKTNFYSRHSFENTERYRQDAADAAARKRSLVVEGCVAYVTIDGPHTSSFRFFLRDVQQHESFYQSDTPEFGCDLTRNGKYACLWMFNGMLTGNDMN